MGYLRDSIHIDAPVDKVWDYARDPAHWPHFITGMSEPSKVSGDGGVGSEVKFTVLMAGVPLHETIRATEDRQDPDGTAHWRGNISGTSTGWMVWDYSPEMGGTQVDLEWEYTVPGDLVGRLADRLVIEKLQARDMHLSLENLKLLIEQA